MNRQARGARRTVDQYVLRAAAPLTTMARTDREAQLVLDKLYAAGEIDPETHAAAFSVARTREQGWARVEG